MNIYRGSAGQAEVDEIVGKPLLGVMGLDRFDQNNQPNPGPEFRLHPGGLHRRRTRRAHLPGAPAVRRRHQGLLPQAAAAGHGDRFAPVPGRLRHHAERGGEQHDREQVFHAGTDQPGAAFEDRPRLQRRGGERPGPPERFADDPERGLHRGLHPRRGDPQERAGHPAGRHRRGQVRTERPLPARLEDPGRGPGRARCHPEHQARVHGDEPQPGNAQRQGPAG